MEGALANLYLLQQDAILVPLAPCCRGGCRLYQQKDCCCNFR